MIGRGIGGKPFLAHAFRSVEGLVSAVETDLVLGRNLPGYPVVRHIVSLDTEIARAGARRAMPFVILALPIRPPKPLPYSPPTPGAELSASGCRRTA